jgi:23S rRNA (guanosine2251-2'-O)-methyltransferase
LAKQLNNKEKDAVTQFLYGRWPVLECLRADRRTPSKLLIAENVQEKGIINDIIDAANQRNVEVRRVPRHMIDDLALDANHQGVILRAGDYPYVEIEDLFEISRSRGEKPFYLALDLLKDPQNVGVLLRVADAVGIHGIIMQERRGVSVTPAVVAASSGAVEHLAVARVTNLVNALKQLKENDVWVVAMDVGPGIDPIDKVDMNRSLAVVMGSEGEGIRRLVRDTCDLVVTLPMRGSVESLNVATAGSITLYNAWQARKWEGWKHNKQGENS